jgi:hypothetical protein
VKARSTRTYLLLHTPEPVLAVNAFAIKALEQLYADSRSLHVQDHLPDYTIWISQEEDIHHFVQQVPQLAWDMLEHAEEPLELLLSSRKYQPPFEDTATEISLRLLTQPRLRQMVRNTGPLITFRLPPGDTAAAEKLAEAVENMHEPSYPYGKVKTMKVFPDESFTFLR